MNDVQRSHRCRCFLKNDDVMFVSDKLMRAWNTPASSGKIVIREQLNLIINAGKQICGGSGITSSNAALDIVQIKEICGTPDNGFHERPRLAFLAARRAAHSSTVNTRFDPSLNPASDDLILAISQTSTVSSLNMPNLLSNEIAAGSSPNRIGYRSSLPTSMESPLAVTMHTSYSSPSGSTDTDNTAPFSWADCNSVVFKYPI